MLKIIVVSWLHIFATLDWDMLDLNKLIHSVIIFMKHQICMALCKTVVSPVC